MSWVGQGEVQNDRLADFDDEACLSDARDAPEIGFHPPVVVPVPTGVAFDQTEVECNPEGLWASECKGGFLGSNFVESSELKAFGGFVAVLERLADSLTDNDVCGTQILQDVFQQLRGAEDALARIGIAALWFVQGALL